jgi:hypothetical protein
MKIVFVLQTKSKGDTTMAQSIYITLETLQTETSVPEIKDKDGLVIRKSFGSVLHSLPRENYPTPEIFDDESDFLDWANENGCLLSLLQAGINDWLIADRAAFKRMVKNNWTLEIGQKNVNERKWSVSKRPEAAKSQEQKAIDILGKMTPEQIAEMMKKLATK